MYSDLGRSTDTMCENVKLTVKTSSESGDLDKVSTKKSINQSRKFLNPFRYIGRRIFKSFRSSIGESSVHSFEIKRHSTIPALNNQNEKESKTKSSSKATKNNVNFKNHNGVEKENNPEPLTEQSEAENQNPPNHTTTKTTKSPLKYMRNIRKDRDRLKRGSKLTSLKRKRFRLTLVGKKSSSSNEGSTNTVSEKERSREQKERERKSHASEKQVVGIYNVCFIYETNV